MLALVDSSRSGDGDEPPAMPGVYRGTEGRSGPVLFTFDVDGERFAIRRAGAGGTAYDWLSGPNKGYGFGSSGTPCPRSPELPHVRSLNLPSCEGLGVSSLTSAGAGGAPSSLTVSS